MQFSDDLFLGTKGHVVRVRKRDGKEVWRTKLKGSNLVVVVVEPDGIFAYTRGCLWALGSDTGAVRWMNNLPGLGYGHGIIASANQIPVTVAAIAAAQAAMLAAGSGSGSGSSAAAGATGS